MRAYLKHNLAHIFLQLIPAGAALHRNNVNLALYLGQRGGIQRQRGIKQSKNLAGGELMAQYGMLRDYRLTDAAEDIRGSKLYGLNDEKLGVIDDVIFDHSTGVNARSGTFNLR